MKEASKNDQDAGFDPLRQF
jgi:hypothetical protein